MPFMFGNTLRTKYLDFSDAQEIRTAKEDIIKNLQALRSRIEQQHIFEARPQEKRESLEI